MKIYYENGECMKTTYHKILDIFGRYNRLSKTAIKNLVDKFESTGSVHNILTTTRLCSNRSAEKIAAVSGSVKEGPNLSIPRHSQQLSLYKSIT